MSRWWGSRRPRPPVGAGLRAVPAEDSAPAWQRWSFLRRAAGLLVALALMTGTVAAVSLTTAPAKAFDFTCAVGGGNAANTGPDRAGVGSGFWLPKQKIPGANANGVRPKEYQATLWEVAGTRGLLWSYSPHVPKADAKGNEYNIDDSQSNFEEACSPVDASAGYVAQMMFEASRFIGGLTIGLKELAVGSAPFEAFYGQGENLVDVLETNVYQPALIAAVMAAGFWVMTRVRRQDDHRETYSGMIWSSIIIVGISAVLVGGNFRAMTESVDRYSSSFNAAALESVDGLTTQGNPPPTSPCRIMETPTVGDDPAENEKEGARRTSCMLYEMLLYNPWSLGQFGTSTPVTVPNLCYDRDSSDRINCERMTWDNYQENPNVRDGCIYSPYRCKVKQRGIGREDASRSEMGVNLAIQQVVAQAYTNNETMGKARNEPNEGDEFTPYERLWQQVQFAVADKHHDKYSMWKGSEPTSRMATAVSTGLINIIMLIAVGLIALLTVFWHGVMFVAWILLPVVGAIAAFPPARRIVVSYLGIMVQAVFLRMVLGLILALLLGIMNAINLADGNTGLKIILMIIAAAAMWKLLSALRSGQMGPTVVSTAGEQGALPSDRVVEKTAGYAHRRWERYQDSRRYRRSVEPAPAPHPARKLPRPKRNPSSPPPSPGGGPRPDPSPSGGGPGPAPDPPPSGGGAAGGPSTGGPSEGGRGGGNNRRPPQ